MRFGFFHAPKKRCAIGIDIESHFAIRGNLLSGGERCRNFILYKNKSALLTGTVPGNLDKLTISWRIRLLVQADIDEIVVRRRAWLAGLYLHLGVGFPFQKTVLNFLR
jgi:hypothetical protein